jgi:putative spermidine/putrescine transport system permease protein
MIRRPPQGLREHAPIVFPAVMLTVFFVIPFAMMIVVSFFTREQGGFYTTDLTLENYARFLSPLFVGILIQSLLLALLAAATAVVLATPFTFLLTRMPRSAQVVWLVGLLAVLALSEVIVGFAWQTLLSRTAGIGNLLAALGIVSESIAFYPSFAGVWIAMTYLTFPYAVLVLYPTLSRLDPHIMEAARSLGAPPLIAFIGVIVPALRTTLISTLAFGFVFALGIYLLPQLLGRPQHWTLSVLITDQALFQSNLPFAAAMAVFLFVVALALVLAALSVAHRSAAGR